MSKTVHIVPHSHIDAEWFFDYETALQWSEDIFRKALDLMRRDPEYHFTQDQVALIRPVYERMSPDDRAFFRDMVRERRFELVGGMYMQPEVAEPHGESLVRQILMGKTWVRETFGVDVEVGWFIDTFGQMNQLPQILVKSGFRYYVFSRDVPLDMNPAEFPAQFWYESPDGSRVLTHLFPGGYGGPGRLEAIFNQSASRHLLMPYGDDVTRPRDDTARMARRVAAMAAKSGLRGAIGEIKTTSVLNYFQGVEAEAGDLPVLRYDFNPPYHRQDLRGTYDGRIELKKLSREAEEALYAAEVANAVAFTRGKPYPKDRLSQQWLRVLHVHFHDIIGGSHHDPVYAAAMGRLRAALDEAHGLTHEALGFLVNGCEPASAATVQQRLFVFNALSDRRTELCRFTPVAPCDGLSLVDDTGRRVPLRKIALPEGSMQIEFIPEDLPAVGGRTYTLAADSPALPTVDAQHARSGDHMIENRFFRIAWDPVTGGLTSIFHKRLEKEFLDPEIGQGNELVAVVEQNPDAEGTLRLTGQTYRSGDYPPESIEVEESDIHIALKVCGPFKDCRRIQEVTLYDALDRIDFHTTLEDFRGGDLFIKVSFPLAIEWKQASIDYETPFAVTTRPLGHFCAQNWVDCADSDFGVALINTGTPGYWVEEGRLEMVLLRSLANYTEYRDRVKEARGGPNAYCFKDVAGLLPEYEASTCTELMKEHGTHTYHYVLYPHEGRWGGSRVVSVGRSLNCPLIPVPQHVDAPASGMGGSGFLSAPSEFAVTAIKVSENGDALIVRGYETTGQERVVSLRLPPWARAAHLADLLENELTPLPLRDQTVRFACKPHEIVTLALRP